MADLKKAFLTSIRDKKWLIKVSCGGCLHILPIANFFCMGYSYRIFKETLNGGEPYLPEWEDSGALFSQGFKIFIMLLVYFGIPKILSWTGLFIILYGFWKHGFWSPWSLYCGFLNPGFWSTLSYVLEHSELIVYLKKGTHYYLLGFVTGIAPNLIWPMAYANYSKNKESILAAFKLWEIIPKISIVFRDYLLALVLFILTRIFLILLLFLKGLLPPFTFIFFVITFRFYLYYLFCNTLFGLVCSKAYAGLPAPADSDL